MDRIEEQLTVGKIVATLRDAVKSGNMKRSFASPLYNSLQKYYETTAATSEDWRQINFSRDDFESRMNSFREHSGYEYKTASAYKARARRAVEVYEEQKRRVAFAAEGTSEVAFIENLRTYWKQTLASDLNDEEKSSYIEVIQCKTRGKGAAAIVVSRDAFIQDLNEIKKTIESMSSRID